MQSVFNTRASWPLVKKQNSICSGQFNIFLACGKSLSLNGGSASHSIEEKVWSGLWEALLQAMDIISSFEKPAWENKFL